MALYTISDLHLPLGVNKPMDIFGRAWENYVQRLCDNWQTLIKDSDTIVLGGDFSWATYLEQTEADFKFLNSLNGNKIILKGNHDYWWTTINKMKNFMRVNNFNKIQFLHNNFYMYGNTAICGTRGWNLPQITQSDEDKKIYERELLRLELSINAAKAKNPDEIIVFLHYPPILKDYLATPFCELMKKEGIKRCYYGHIHKNGAKNAAEGKYDGIYYRLCSCDHLGFLPIEIIP